MCIGIVFINKLNCSFSQLLLLSTGELLVAGMRQGATFILFLFIIFIDIATEKLCLHNK